MLTKISRILFQLDLTSLDGLLLHANTVNVATLCLHKLQSQFPQMLVAMLHMPCALVLLHDPSKADPSLNTL